MKFRRTWAYRLFILVLILNGAAYYQTIRFADFPELQEVFEKRIFVIGSAAALCLIAGLIMVGMMIQRRELKGGKPWIAAIGLFLVMAITILAGIFGIGI